MIKIIARISASGDSVTQLGVILQALALPSQAEPGCVSYELFQDDETPTDFITVERWVDSTAAEAHLSSPHVVSAITQAASLLAQPPLIHRFTQLA